MKNLSTLFDYALNNYAIEDLSFQKTFDLRPCPITLNKMRLLKQKLNLIYKNKTKRLPQELT